MRRIIGWIMIAVLALVSLSFIVDDFAEEMAARAMLVCAVVAAAVVWMVLR